MKPKNKKPNLKPVILDYGERVQKMTAQSITAELKAITQDYGEFIKVAKTMERGTILAANFARSIGIQLKTLCRHEQIHLSFWENNCKGLPFSFHVAKNLITIADKMPQAAKTLAEAAPFVQAVFLTAELLQLEHRSEKQNALTVDQFAWMIDQMNNAVRPFKKLISDKPMEKWEPLELEKFIDETEWFHQEREKALKLRWSKTGK